MMLNAQRENYLEMGMIEENRELLTQTAGRILRDLYPGYTRLTEEEWNGIFSNEDFTEQPVSALTALVVQNVITNAINEKILAVNPTYTACVKTGLNMYKTGYRELLGSNILGRDRILYDRESRKNGLWAEAEVYMDAVLPMILDMSAVAAEGAKLELNKEGECVDPQIRVLRAQMIFSMLGMNDKLPEGARREKDDFYELNKEDFYYLLKCWKEIFAVYLGDEWKEALCPWRVTR